MADKDRRREIEIGFKNSNPGAPQVRAFSPKKIESSSSEPFNRFKTEGEVSDNQRFHLHPDSKRLLGIDSKEKDYLQSRIDAEVKIRLEAEMIQAREIGKKQGYEEGTVQATAELQEKLRPKVENFEALIAELNEQKQKIFSENQKVLMQMLFHTAKLILLRELKTDPEYLQRLCSVLIERVGTAEGMKLKISKVDADQIEELRNFAKVQAGDQKNIKVEVSEDLQLGGVRIETDLIRINATLEQQFQAIENELQGKVAHV